MLRLKRICIVYFLNKGWGRCSHSYYTREVQEKLDRIKEGISKEMNGNPESKKTQSSQRNARTDIKEVL